MKVTIGILPMEIKDIRRKTDNIKGRRDEKLEELNKNEKQILSVSAELEDSLRSQKVIQKVSRDTQAQLEFRIGPPVSAALDGVFDDPYEFILRFEDRRGQSEADLTFKRNGTEYKDLMYSGGGGEVDVAAWGLWIASHSLGSTRPFLLADEPLKFLKSRNKVLEERGAMMIQETSHQLDLQVLMISHIPEQQQGADKTFRLTLKGGVTEVIKG